MWSSVRNILPMIKLASNGLIVVIVLAVKKNQPTGITCINGEYVTIVQQEHDSLISDSLMQTNDASAAGSGRRIRRIACSCPHCRDPGRKYV